MRKSYYTRSNFWVSFFILMSLTTTIGFIYSWSVITLFLATVFNIIASVIKYRIKEKNIFGEISLGASLVAVIHLIPACMLALTTNTPYYASLPVDSFATLVAVGFAIGAVIVNIVSVTLLLLEMR